MALYDRNKTAGQPYTKSEPGAGATGSHCDIHNPPLVTKFCNQTSIRSLSLPVPYLCDAAMSGSTVSARLNQCLILRGLDPRVPLRFAPPQLYAFTRSASSRGSTLETESLISAKAV
jgi:hypothetical protein